MEEQLDPVTRWWALSHFPPLVKKRIRVIPRPVPPTHLAPCKFWCFPCLKMRLSGQRFISVREIQLKSIADLTSIPQETLKCACRSGRTLGGACALCVQSCWLTFYTIRIFLTTNYAWVPERTVSVVLSQYLIAIIGAAASLSVSLSLSLSHGTTALVGLGLGLFCDVRCLHSDTPRGRTLDEWSALRRDLLRVEHSTPHSVHSCRWRNSNPQSQQASGHWDRWTVT